MNIYNIEENHPKYPQSLREISSPPKQLYYCGDISLLQTPCVAIVGSRKCTTYGVTVARSLAKTLAKNGVTIVSGLAQGIDAAAHSGALEVGGKTIAVMGSGVDVCYPRENRGLMSEILAQNLIVSEYAPGTKPRTFHFPQRNRIISGLSQAVILVESAYRSGSLITAEHAVDQNKLLYVVPGNITSKASVGSNQLLRDGAEPLLYAEDVLRALHITPRKSQQQALPLGEDEQKIVALLQAQGELSTDDICGKTYLSASTVNGLITVLEMKGLVVSSMGKVFLAEVLDES